MIFELILFAGGLISGGAVMLPIVRESSIKQVVNHTPQLSQTVQLVSALLDEDDWENLTDTGMFIGNRKAGVQLHVIDGVYGAAILRVLDETNNHYVQVKVNEDEKRELTRKFKSFAARTKNSKSDRIARALAGRIVGTALLGGPGSSSYNPTNTVTFSNEAYPSGTVLLENDKYLYFVPTSS